MDVSSRTVDPETRIVYVTVLGRDFSLRPQPPYGLWGVHTTVGKLPEALSGRFTSPDDALKAVVTYMKSFPKHVKEDTTPNASPSND